MRNSKAIKDIAKEIMNMGALLEQCNFSNAKDYLEILENIKKEASYLQNKLNKLQNFEISFDKMMNNKIELTNKAFKKSNGKDILDKISEIKYKYEGQYLKIEKVFLSVLEDVAKDKEVQEYFNSCKGEENTKEYIKNGIKRLFEMLNDARNSDDLAKKVEFENVLKAYGIIAKVLQKPNISPIEKITRLTMMANASENCSSAWKETLLVLLTSLEENLDSKLRECEERDLLSKSLEQIFICARVKIAEDLGNRLIEQEAVEEAYRPHWMDICKNALNEEYGFNLADIHVKDVYTSLAGKLKIKCKFLEEIQYLNVNDLIYDKACEIFYDEICMNSSIKNDASLKENYKKMKANGSLSSLVIDWARKYIDKNDLWEEEPDILEFMYKYIMNANHDDKIRYIAIKEIMKDYGFIVEVELGNSKWYENPNVSVTRISRAIEDIRTKENKKAFLDKLLDTMESDDNIAFNFTSDNFYIREFLNESRIKTLLEASVDINNRTFLMQECEKGNEQNVKVLIEMGEDVNKANDMGTTALMYAVKNNQKVDLIKMLLEKGADVNKTNKNGITSLMIAIFTKKNIDIVKTLLDAGADVNKPEEEGGFTPLMIAVLNDADIKIIKLLLDNGADVNVKCEKKGGYTVSSIANAFKRTDVIDLIKEYQDKKHKVKLENILDNRKTLTRDTL